VSTSGACCFNDPVLKAVGPTQRGRPRWAGLSKFGSLHGNADQGRGALSGSWFGAGRCARSQSGVACLSLRRGQAAVGVVAGSALQRHGAPVLKCARPLSFAYLMSCWQWEAFLGSVHNIAFLQTHRTSMQRPCRVFLPSGGIAASVNGLRSLVEAARCAWRPKGCRPGLVIGNANCQRASCRPGPASRRPCCRQL
jgi:hypothetical protein